jgi:hypothetical protein
VAQSKWTSDIIIIFEWIHTQSRISPFHLFACHNAVFLSQNVFFALSFLANLRLGGGGDAVWSTTSFCWTIVVAAAGSKVPTRSLHGIF